MGRPKLLVIRVCELCGTDSSYKDYYYKGEKLEGQHLDWYSNYNDYKTLCGKCWRRLRQREKRKDYTRETWKKIWQGYTNRTLRFKKTSKIYGHDIKCGVCNYCRKVAGIDCARTERHHEQYDKDNPLAYTIELCTSCHVKETYRFNKHTGRL